MAVFACWAASWSRDSGSQSLSLAFRCAGSGACRGSCVGSFARCFGVFLVLSLLLQRVEKKNRLCLVKVLIRGLSFCLVEIMMAIWRFCLGILLFCLLPVALNDFPLLAFL